MWAAQCNRKPISQHQQGCARDWVTNTTLTPRTKTRSLEIRSIASQHRSACIRTPSWRVQTVPKIPALVQQLECHICGGILPAEGVGGCLLRELCTSTS